MTKKSFYVTTPIYYVNAEPHIGHAYTTILADVLARYHRMMGDPTLFLTGTDEHGQKVQQAAAAGGITPQQHADKTVGRFIDLWKKLGITNDDFIRTTEERHRIVVQKLMQNLYDRGEIYRAEYDGWYCVACERFFTEKDLVDGKCPEPACGRAVEKIREANYFFRMSKYQDWLVQYIDEHPDFIRPDYRRNETLGFLRKKLNDLCVSRPKSRMSWGIELPFDRDFVTYVWFDALVNYISAAGYLSDDVKFGKWWPASVQLIGKDILTTHTVYWTTMLKAMDLPMPETIFAHGWWLSGESKMSKTAGNVVNPMEFATRYGVDAFRYFLLSEMVLGRDASFTEEAFIRRYNSDLANDLGNLLSRIVKMIHDYAGGAVPECGPAGESELQLKGIVLGASEAMLAGVTGMRPDRGIEAVIAAVRESNKYVEHCQPWALKKKGDTVGLGTVLYTAAEALRIISGLLFPLMPEKMAQLRGVLGFSGENPDIAKLKVWGELKPGTKIGDLVSLFPRIQQEKVGQGGGKAATETSATPVVQTDKIEYADFQKIQLRTAVVLSAEKVEGADKLLKLQVQIGGENRQIVAGIAQHYSPEQIVGRTIIVVANLKPAKIRGVESNGMLLAVTAPDNKLRLVAVDGETGSGCVVK